MSPPVAADAGQAEAVSARYGHRVGEDVLTQRAQEVLLREETDCGGHFLKMELNRDVVWFTPKFHLKTTVTEDTLQKDLFEKILDKHEEGLLKFIYTNILKSALQSRHLLQL